MYGNVQICTEMYGNGQKCIKMDRQVLKYTGTYSNIRKFTEMYSFFLRQGCIQNFIPDSIVATFLAFKSGTTRDNAFKICPGVGAIATAVNCIELKKSKNLHGIMAIIPANAGIMDYRESNATFVQLLRSKKWPLQWCRE